jgi:hypothetical protein
MMTVSLEGPTFEGKFARMEFVDNVKFSLSFMQNTGKWVVLYERLPERMPGCHSEGLLVSTLEPQKHG